MGAGIAVDFCDHFIDLRRRVESEVSVKPALVSIFYEEEKCWVYNLVTKRFHFNCPNRDDFRECLVLMRENALLNKVEEIHMPRIGAGLDALEWSQSRSTILEVFRDQPIRISVYVPNSSGSKKRRTMSHEPQRKDSASSDSDQTVPYDLMPEPIDDGPARMPMPTQKEKPMLGIQDQLEPADETVFHQIWKLPTQRPPNVVDSIVAEAPELTLEDSARSITSSRIANPASSRYRQSRTETVPGRTRGVRRGLIPRRKIVPGRILRVEKGLTPQRRIVPGRNQMSHLVNSVIV